MGTADPVLPEPEDPPLDDPTVPPLAILWDGVCDAEDPPADETETPIEPAPIEPAENSEWQNRSWETSTPERADGRGATAGSTGEWVNFLGIPAQGPGLTRATHGSSLAQIRHGGSATTATILLTEPVLETGGTSLGVRGVHNGLTTQTPRRSCHQSSFRFITDGTLLQNRGAI